MSVLRRLRDHGSFSAHRNDIHYNDRWPYPDLYELLSDAEIGLLPAGWDVDVDDLDHNLKVAQIFGFCSAHMLLDVLSPLPKFREYCERLKRWLSPDWHPILNAGALSGGLEALQGQRASA